MKTFLENIEMLSAAIGTSGDEEKVKNLIYREVIAYPSCVAKTDNAGNLIVSKKGKKQPKNRIMFSAHMDEVGFIITHIDENGFLKFSPIGDIDTRVIVDKRVLVGENAIPGLLGSKAIHLVKKEEFEKPISTKDLYIDIGAENRDEAEKLVSIGDRAVFDSDFSKFGDGFVMGKALDGRICCAMLMELLKDGAEFDFTVCFTSREEIQGGGASSAAFSVDPDIAIVVDSCAAGDTPSLPGDKFICKSKKGPVIPFRDKGTLYDLELYKIITEICDKNKIEWQTKHGVCGENGAEFIHKTRGGIKTAAVLIPARYVRSPYTAVNLSDAEKAVSLLKILSTEVCDL